MRRWIYVLGIALAGLVIRLLRIRELPITNDEAIYIRWAQLIAGDWSLVFSLPLADPKPPVHFALLATVAGISSDPLIAGRVLSAVFGSATIVVAAMVAGEVAALIRLDRMRLSVIAAILAAASPYLFFHQRLATADALFVFECTLAVGLALRAPQRVRDAIPFAIVLAVAVLTRQGVSYLLLPAGVIAAVITAGLSRLRPVLIAFASAAVVAALLMLPYLAAQPHLYDGGPVRELRRRLLYQPQFTSVRADAGANAAMLFVPARSAAGEPVTGWLPFYLTAPVVVASLAGLTITARRHPAVCVWLVLWFALLTLPLVLFASVLYSRYALPATMPLLIAAAIAFERLSGANRMAGAIVLLLSLGWPAREIHRQIASWEKTTLVERDAWQYLWGWPAGFGTESAIRWLTARAAAEPVTVVTTHSWGLPADAVWVYAPSRRWTVLYTDRSADQPVLGGGLIANKWIEREPKSVHLTAPVYFVAAVGDTAELHRLVALNRPIEPPREFRNPPGRYGQPPEAAVIVARLQ